jgi:hypothetical protein
MNVKMTDSRTKATHALAAVAGCAIGFFAMAIIYAECFFKTCENTHDGDGFECSRCKSHTDYHPATPFNFCPICGAFCIRRERI